MSSKHYSPDSQKYYIVFKPASDARDDGYLVDTSYLSLFRAENDELIATLEHRDLPKTSPGFGEASLHKTSLGFGEASLHKTSPGFGEASLHKTSQKNLLWFTKGGQQYLICPSLRSCAKKYCDPNDVANSAKWNTYWYQNYIVNCETGELHPSRVGEYVNDDMSLMINRYYDGYGDVLSVLDFSKFEQLKECPLMEAVADEGVDLLDSQLLGDPVFNRKYPQVPNTGQSHSRCQKLMILPGIAIQKQESLEL